MPLQGAAESVETHCAALPKAQLLEQVARRRCSRDEKYPKIQGARTSLLDIEVSSGI